MSPPNGCLAMDKRVEWRRKSGNIDRRGREPCVESLDEDINQGLAGVKGFTSIEECFIELGSPWESLWMFTAEIFDVVAAQDAG